MTAAPNVMDKATKQGNFRMMSIRCALECSTVPQPFSFRNLGAMSRCRDRGGSGKGASRGIWKACSVGKKILQIGTHGQVSRQKAIKITPGCEDGPGDPLDDPHKNKQS
jgi:hypothetical protein